MILYQWGTCALCTWVAMKTVLTRKTIDRHLVEFVPFENFANKFVLDFHGCTNRMAMRINAIHFAVERTTTPFYARLYAIPFPMFHFTRQSQGIDRNDCMPAALMFNPVKIYLSTDCLAFNQKEKKEEVKRIFSSTSSIHNTLKG